MKYSHLVNKKVELGISGHGVMPNPPKETTMTWLDNRLEEFQKNTILNLSTEELYKLRLLIANYALACKIDSSVWKEVQDVLDKEDMNNNSKLNLRNNTMMFGLRNSDKKNVVKGNEETLQIIMHNLFERGDYIFEFEHPPLFKNISPPIKENSSLEVDKRIEQFENEASVKLTTNTKDILRNIMANYALTLTQDAKFVQEAMRIIRA